MTEDPVEGYVIEAAAGADLILDAESLAAVVANTRILRARFAEFADIPLPDDLDPGPLLRL
jgi:hypothetical protein